MALMTMNNNQHKQDSQKRFLLAIVLSLTFFMAYNYFYIEPQQRALQKQQASKKNQVKEIQNSNASTNNKAPTVQTVEENSKIPQIKDITKETIISTIKTKNMIYEIDSLGRIAQVTLREKKYIDENQNALKLFNNKQLRPLEVRFLDSNINEQAFKTIVQASKKNLDVSFNVKTLVLTQKLDKTTLTKTLKFYPDGHYDLNIKTSNKQKYFITPGFRPDLAADMYADHGALLTKNDGTLVIIEDEDLNSNTELVGIHVVSAFDRYYTTVLFNYSKNLQVSVMKNKDESPESFIHIDTKLDLKGYSGPKEYNLLKLFNVNLTNIIEYGWFTFIAKPMFIMLQTIHNILGNWGWTIITTTILLKLILSPLAYKGMVSMNKLKELSPKVKELQEKYKDDKQKASVHMMELYKKEGSNPMGGCLPILLQIPVFFAIYRVLLNSIELKGAEWIWFVQDLTHKVSMSNLLDPYIIIPIFMGLTMFIQQKITPNQMQDEMQRKMFMMLPIVFTIFFIFFEAGLVIYWTVNNIFTIAQQAYINSIFEKQKLLKKQAHILKKNNKKK
jgi:YidC/Oxa1 family membrane protein insertase